MKKEQPQQNKEPAKTQEVRMEDARPQTPGDTFYDVFQFLVGKVFMVAATAALAFKADKEFGPKKIGPFPNFLQGAQRWAENALKPLKSIGKEGGKLRDAGQIVATGAASAFILCHGGNVFAPVIKWLENSRGKIVHWYNKTFSTPENVQRGDEKYHDMPKQNWKDVIKGRAFALATGFTVASGAYLIGGKSKNPNFHYKLDVYEEWVGRKVAWLNKASRPISKIPMTEKIIDEGMRKNKWYRFGKVAALDLYITSMAIIVWNTVSRLSAKNRVKEEKAQQRAQETQVEIGDTQPDPQEQRFTDKIQSRESLPEHPQKTEDPSYANLVSQQRLTEETKAPALSS